MNASTTDASAGVDTGEPVQSAPDPTTRSRFMRAAAIGGVLGAVVFAWMVTAGTFDLFHWTTQGNFYDAQAHSILHGHLAIDPDVLGIEGFLGRAGNTYMYQGPFPALLRLPIVAVAGHAGDGRLTALSMLVALAVMLVFATRLHWGVRELVRRASPVTRSEAWFVGLFTFVLAAGSPFLYQASKAWVYHEALCWGVALALGAIDRLLAFVRRPSTSSLCWASALTVATLLTRASIGLGLLFGLALVAIGAACARLAARRGHRWPWVTWLAPGTEEQGHPQRLVVLGAAVVAPVFAYAVVNYLKFESLFSVPFYGQRYAIDPGHRAMLDANNGTFFGLQFAPTSLLHYLRPDAIEFTRTFPFVDFPRIPGTVVGDVFFDLIDRSASLPVVAPFLLVLVAVGATFAFRPSRWHEAGRAGLRVPMLAAAAGAATILPFGYIANRYLADFMPLLVLAGAVGLQVLLGGAPSSVTSHAWRVAGGVALVALAAWSCWVNVGLALRYQREWSPNAAPELLAGFLGFQDDVSRALGGDGIGPAERVGARDPLPNGIGRAGTLLIVGDCDGLYVSDGMDVNSFKPSPWNAVERGAGTGHRRFRVTVPHRPKGTIVPIMTADSDTPRGILLEYLGGDSVRLLYRTDGPDDRVDVPFDIDFGREYDVDVVTDWRVDTTKVRWGDATRLETFSSFDGEWQPGRNDVFDDVATRFPGALESERVTAPLCDELLARATSS